MDSYLKIYTNPNNISIKVIEKFSRKLKFWTVKIYYSSGHSLAGQEVYASDPKSHYKHDEAISELERILTMAVTLGEKTLFKELVEADNKPLYFLRKDFNPHSLSKEDFVKQNPVLTSDDVTRIVKEFREQPFTK